MKLLLKKATILDNDSKFHLTQQDILIENGIFTKIATTIDEQADQIIEVQDLFVSTGFMDIFSHFNDPGFEQNETLATGAKAAQKGGYTSVMIIPNTKPVIDNKTSVEYIVQQSKTLPVQILPIAAISTNTDGASLTEMIEMRQAGAIAFSDGKKATQNASLLLKALQYVKTFNGTVIQMPYDASLIANGLVNESVQSTQLGLQGIPSIAEEIMIQRDIALCAYTNSAIHFTGVSTSKSLDIIKEAKKNGINVTCSVSPYHLYLNDKEVVGYNTDAKVNPPLRLVEDNIALQQGVLDGSIDCIAAHHFPLDADAKQCEFSAAQFGMSTIENCFNVVASIPNIDANKVYELMSKHPKQLFGIENVAISEKNICNITAFTLSDKTTVNTSKFLSKGKNSAFASKVLNGKIIATINEMHHYIAQIN